MGLETLAIAGMGLGAAGNIFGGIQQNQQANQNFRAQQEFQRWMQQQVLGQMQPQQNQIGQQMMNFFGLGQGPGSAFQYQPTQGFTYTPAQLGGAPEVAAPGLGAAPQVTAPMLGATPQVTAPILGPAPTVQAGQVGAPPPITLSQINALQAAGPEQVGVPQVNAQQVAGPGQLNIPLVSGATIGEQWNPGQDSLMQLLNKQFGPAADQDLQSNLRQLYGGESFDASKVLGSLEPIDQRLLEEQASALRGSAGSLGQRFGSEMLGNEQRLRSGFLQDIGARNAQITQQAYEAGQGRRLQALGLGAGREQFLSQLPFQAAGLQAQIGSQLLNTGTQRALTQAQLQQQAQLANQSAGLQAGLQTQQLGQQGGQFNAANALQAQLANQAAGLQASLQTQQLGQQGGQFNIANAMQAQQANAANALQAALQTQQLGQQGQQFNVAQMLQGGLANQQLAGQYGLQGAQNALQAALANQQLAGQFGLQGAQMGMQAGLANQQMMGQYGLGGADMAMRALLANQGMAGQYGLANQQAMNQAGQFNAGQQQQQGQFNAQQGNIFNQMMMSAMTGANQMNMGNAGLNAQLLGILGAGGVPQQNAPGYGAAAGDALSMMMMFPWMIGQMGGGGRVNVPYIPPTGNYPLPWGL
jgi:hypothetical protein